MKIVLLFRRKKELFLYNEIGWENEYYHFVKESISAWNLFFRMDYISFRKRLREITEQSVSKNNFDLVFLYEDIQEIEKLEPGTLVVPLDDDDWLSSSFSKEVAPYEGTDLYWNVYRLWGGGKRKFFNNIDSIVPSCGYGTILPCKFDILNYHWLFNKEKAHYIDKVLSVKLDNPSSMEFLWRKGKLVSFEKLIKRIFSTMRLPGEMPEEFNLYWNRYIDICKELLESCKIPYNYILEKR